MVRPLPPKKMQVVYLSILPACRRRTDIVVAADKSAALSSRPSDIVAEPIRRSRSSDAVSEPLIEVKPRILVPA